MASAAGATVRSARRCGLDKHGGTLSKQPAIELDRHHKRHVHKLGARREWWLLWRRRREYTTSRRRWLRLTALQLLQDERQEGWRGRPAQRKLQRCKRDVKHAPQVVNAVHAEVIDSLQRRPPRRRSERRTARPCRAASRQRARAATCASSAMHEHDQRTPAWRYRYAGSWVLGSADVVYHPHKDAGTTGCAWPPQVGVFAALQPL